MNIFYCDIKKPLTPNIIHWQGHSRLFSGLPCGKKQCMRVMEHFLHCISDFTSSSPILCAHISPFSLWNFFPNLSLFFPPLSSHYCFLFLPYCSLLCLSLRSGDVNPLQGSTFWGLAKWHPCNPECTGAGQRNIYLQCKQLPGPWQVGMLILEMNTDELSG